MRATLVVGLAAVALAAAPAAGAEVFGVAQVRTAGGSLLASADGPSFAYPADGSVISIRSIAAAPRRIDLKDVSLLGGEAQVDHLRLDGRGTTIDGLVVTGLLRDPTQNSLFSIDGSGYLVARQTAMIGGTTGFVSLRLVVPAGYPGVPAGTQVLVGLREHGSAGKQKPKPGQRAKQGAGRWTKQGAGRWTALGFAVAPKLAGSPAVADPLLFSVPLLPPVWSSDTGSRAVALAEQFLGVPYQWGGASPLTGFDCSGLTRYVYGQFGIALVHYAAAQLGEGYPVDVQGLMPGDLVFFDPGPAGPGHVGIYAGNGMFIHAPHTGDVVKISPLSSYASRYVGAVRPYRGA